jgi:hypothetical protein
VKINVREYRRGNQNGQSRENENIGYTRRRKTKQKHNTICVGHHYTQTNTNNVNKVRVFIVFLNNKMWLCATGCQPVQTIVERIHLYN